MALRGIDLGLLRVGRYVNESYCDLVFEEWGRLLLFTIGSAIVGAGLAYMDR